MLFQNLNNVGHARIENTIWYTMVFPNRSHFHNVQLLRLRNLVARGHWIVKLGRENVRLLHWWWGSYVTMKTKLCKHYFVVQQICTARLKIIYCAWLYKQLTAFWKLSFTHQYCVRVTPLIIPWTTCCRTPFLCRTSHLYIQLMIRLFLHCRTFFIRWTKCSEGCNWLSNIDR